MYKCKECNEKFEIPETKVVDAGGIMNFGIIRKYKIPSMNFCPHCLSVKIEKETV